jgi:hypothetical protein
MADESQSQNQNQENQNQENQNQDQTPEPKKETVAFADHERVIADLNKAKKEMERLKSERENEKTAKLKEQSQWKELAEKYETDAKTAREESDRLRNSYVEGKKFAAVQEKCLALGLRAEAVSDLEMLDLVDVQIETTNTGKTSVLGADKFAERLKTLKPHWFAGKSAPNVNTDGTRVIDGEPITPAMLLKAEAEGKKSGDLSGYHAMFKTFQSQRANGLRR